MSATGVRHAIAQHINDDRRLAMADIAAVRQAVGKHQDASELAQTRDLLDRVEKGELWSTYKAYKELKDLVARGDEASRAGREVARTRALVGGMVTLGLLWPLSLVAAPLAGVALALGVGHGALELIRGGRDVIAKLED